jgi:hypothetical protein
MTRRFAVGDAWIAGLVAAAALMGTLAGSLVAPGLGSPVALVLIPVGAAAAWLYRGELQAGGWRTVAGIAVLFIGLALLLVSPSHLARLVP